MRRSNSRFLCAASLLLLGASPLAAQDPAAHPFVCAPDGSATLVLPAGHSGSHPVTAAMALFENDRGNHALDCADGRSGSPDPIAVTCQYGHSGNLAIHDGTGIVTLHTLGATSHSDQSGVDVHREEVVIVDADGHPVHTLVQWSQTVADGQTHTLRRRYKTADVDHDGMDELCVESVGEFGPGRAAIVQAGRYRPSRRTSGVDAFHWDGHRFVRMEELDGSCPRSGYALFVAMPVGTDAVGMRRDAR